LTLSKVQAQESFTDPRDSAKYQTIQIDDLIWLSENLRFRSGNKKDTMLAGGCGVFYLVHDAMKVCPEGWRLPTIKEVERLIKKDKKRHLILSDTLNIKLCGRIDTEKHSKYGQQNTFWQMAELEEGHIDHWHTFGEEHKIHSHNVVNVRRKFPVRCVRRLP
jgi:hypothetical protein